LSSLVLDAGAFVAVDRNDRAMIARLRVAQRSEIALRTSAIVISQVWRDPLGRQAQLARLLHAVEVRGVDDPLGREAGVLIGQAQTQDPIDATVVLVADHGDRILTSDPEDIQHLAGCAGKRVAVIAC
jgi:predicted nucleic acid-binding protein